MSRSSVFLDTVPRPSGITCLEKVPWPSACLDTVTRPSACLDTLPQPRAITCLGKVPRPSTSLDTVPRPSTTPRHCAST